MNIKSFVLVLGIAATTLAGCASAPDTLSVISSATNIAYEYEQGRVVDYVDNVELSNLDQTRVLEALDQIDRSKAIIEDYMDKPDHLLLNIHDVSFQYAKIKASYLSIREIVITNRDLYSALEWNTFVQFDQDAQTLDAQFKDLVEAVETRVAMATAIRLADTVIKIGALL